jgi:nicotinate-nucleotide adenylyltransferase
MKTGLFFGSFNPIHNGHLIVAQHMLQELGLDNIWFVVSPHNPFKANEDLWPEQTRLDLVRKAIEGNTGFKACDIEFNMPRPSYTYLTLEKLIAENPHREFVLLMGSDNLERLKDWKNINQILETSTIEIYQRPYADYPNPFPDKVKVHRTPLLEISATFIRQQLKKGLSIRYLVPENVIREIESFKG